MCPKFGDLMAEICRYETNIFWLDGKRDFSAIRGVGSTLLEAIAKIYPQILNYSKGVDLVREHERVVIVIKVDPRFLEQFPQSALPILQIVSRTVGTTSSRVRDYLR